jgi:hypothetical protein
MSLHAGLCETCTHIKRLDSGRSIFYMCTRAEKDPAFPRYPRLPVLACKGYEERSATMTPPKEK